jgi:hypothetical protein
LPEFLSVAMMRAGALAGEMTRLPHRAAPDDAADVPGGGVDLVEHAPGIGDVEEAVLGERCRLDEFTAVGAGERHRIGEFQALDVGLVDAGERREALAVITAVVHQPVLRLLVGIEQPLRRHLGRQHGRCGEHAAGEQRCEQRLIAV